MESESSIFLFDGQMVDVSKLSLEQIDEMIKKVDSKIRRLEDELNESLFEEE